MHPDEHRALDRQNAGSDHVSAGCQRKVAGMMTLTVYINSTMPRVGQASRGNASRDRTSFVIQSNIKTFMTPDAAYTSAAAGSYQRTYDGQTGNYRSKDENGRFRVNDLEISRCECP
jgi:hypothetical protein